MPDRDQHASQYADMTIRTLSRFGFGLAFQCCEEAGETILRCEEIKRRWPDSADRPANEIPQRFQCPTCNAPHFRARIVRPVEYTMTGGLDGWVADIENPVIRSKLTPAA